MASKQILVVDSRVPPDTYPAEGITIGIGVYWATILTIVGVALWCGGIVWWVAKLANTVANHDRILEKDLPNRDKAVVEKMQAQIENSYIRLEGAIDGVRSDIEHLEEALKNASDIRSKTLTNMHDQIVRQGRENVEQQRELQRIEGVVETLAGMKGYGNISSTPGYYQQPPSGRHNIHRE